MRRIFVIAVVTCAAGMVAHARPRLTTVPGVTISTYAEHLNDPRGLAFNPQGDLYVAEAGSGGASESTIGLCDQVLSIGPIVGGATGRVIQVTPSGGTNVVIDGLPSSEARPDVGGDKQGAAAVAFVGQQMFTLVSGGGCSHGHADLLANNGILATDRFGTTRLADLSAWLIANPGPKGLESPRSPDYEPDGTWYSMLVDQGRLLALEPNHGQLISVHPQTGAVQLVSDLFGRFGDHTYSSMAIDRGDLYIGTLGQIVWNPAPPVPDFVNSFAAGIYRLGRNGSAEQVATGLHAVLGIAFDAAHRLYAIQSPIFLPGTGSFVRVDPDGTIVPIVTGLDFPSAVVRGPDGAFYISDCGFHCNPGAGRVLRVTF
jgi:hypothetical protein